MSGLPNFCTPCGRYVPRDHECVRQQHPAPDNSAVLARLDAIDAALLAILTRLESIEP